MKTVPEAGTSDAQAYEFTAAQNEVIGSAGFWVSTWGVFSLLASSANLFGGVLLFVDGGLGGVAAGIILGLLALIPLFLGLKFLRTGKELRAVVWTKGNDIDHLMAAIQNVSGAFRIQIVAVVCWVAILIVFMVVFVETQVR